LYLSPAICTLVTENHPGMSSSDDSDSDEDSDSDDQNSGRSTQMLRLSTRLNPLLHRHFSMLVEIEPDSHCSSHGCSVLC
jgi:hypothetical protein